MKHTHYIVQAYSDIADGGQLKNVTTVDIFADSEEQAIKRAKQLVKKEHYRVSQIVEHDPEMESEHSMAVKGNE